MVLLPVFQHGVHALGKLMEIPLHFPLVLKLLLRDKALVLNKGILTELTELLEAHLQLLVQVGVVCGGNIPQEDLGDGIRALHSEMQQRRMQEERKKVIASWSLEGSGKRFMMGLM